MKSLNAFSHKITVTRHLKSLGYLPNDLKITHKQLQQAIATFQVNHRKKILFLVEFNWIFAHKYNYLI